MDESSVYKGSESSMYKGSEVSTSKNMDSAYGSLTTSQYHRSSSSKSPSSNLRYMAIYIRKIETMHVFLYSKSSASGSSGFGCYKNEAANKTGASTQGEAQSVTGSSSQGKKKEQKKKSKSKLAAAPVASSQTKKPEEREGQGQRQTPITDDKAATVAALTKALDCIDKFRKSNQESKDGPDQREIEDFATNLQEASQEASTKSNNSFHFGGGGVGVEATKCEQITKVLDKEQLSTAVGGFCAAVSLNDGMVLQTTPTITAVLGFPKDMWHGRSFIDFVHPMDRTTFTNKITSTVMLPFGDLNKNPSKMEKEEGAGAGKTSTVMRSSVALFDASHSFFCRLRMYNSLKQGKFSVRNQNTVYTPFKLRVDFREIGACTADPAVTSEVGSSPKSGSMSEATSGHSGNEVGIQSVCLIIAAIPLTTAYNQADQMNPVGGTFMTRHSAAGKYTKVDESAIPYLGYLPQDMEGEDIFDFYHPSDLGTIKEAYENIMADQGKSFKSGSYGFKVKNGGYITLETVWSCFINPWSKKLEFVDGKHTILKGPSNPAVFADPGEVPSEQKQNEDANDSNKATPANSSSNATPVAQPRNSDEVAETGSSSSPVDPKKQKSLQESIKILLKEPITRVAASYRADFTHHSSRRRKKLASFMGTLLEEMTRVETPKALSTTGNTSVLGNISPHHDETGSESPPSYNQLNYNDNLTRFFNSQPKTLTEKEASESEPKSIMSKEAFKNAASIQAHAYDTSSGSRLMRSESPPFDNSNTATNSESGNGGSNSREKPSKPTSSEKKGNNKGEILADGSGSGSGEHLYSGGTGTGTSGGVSAAANAHHKRIHAHTYRTLGSGGSGGSGEAGSGYIVCNAPNQLYDNYKAPLLTEQLLLAHNRGMEKKMIDSYKEGQKGHLRFFKNRQLRKSQALKQKTHHHHHHPWKEVHDKVHHKPLPGTVASAADPQASTIQLWPPFSVANATALPIQVRPTQSGSASLQPSTTMMSSNAAAQVSGTHHLQQRQANPADTQSLPHPSAVGPSSQAMYSNLIPAYYIPPHISSNQKPTGGYFVSVPTIFSQQPLHVQPFQGLYHHPMESHLPGNFGPGAASQMSSINLTEPGRSSQMNHPVNRDVSPDLQNTLSIDSSMIEEATRSISHEKSTNERTGQPSFKFQRPSSRTGSRATSVKAEPGSALESNLESNASISASVKAMKMPSPGGRGGFIATASDRAIEQVMESTDSSMCSLLKSSDDFTPTTSNGSEEDEKDCGGSGASGGPARPSLPDPFWLTNVEMTPQLTLNYQAKPRDLSEVLKRDYEYLKNVNQPNQVKEQLAQLYRELEDMGATIKPLLEEEASASCTSSTSSSSAADENEEDQKQRQVLLHVFLFLKNSKKCVSNFFLNATLYF